MRKSLILSFLLAVSLALVSCGGGASGPVKTSGISLPRFCLQQRNCLDRRWHIHRECRDRCASRRDRAHLRGDGSGHDVGNAEPGGNAGFQSGERTTLPENQLTIVNNATEAGVAHVTLPGYTESFVVSPDSSTGYVAVPNAPSSRTAAGSHQDGCSCRVEQRGFLQGRSIFHRLHYLAIDNGGDRILAFSDNSDSIAVVTPSNMGTSNQVVTYVGGFDRPVQAFFSSDDTTAYVINCGAECGGTQASVQQFDMTTIR